MWIDLSQVRDHNAGVESVMHVIILVGVLEVAAGKNTSDDVSEGRKDTESYGILCSHQGLQSVFKQPPVIPTVSS